MTALQPHEGAEVGRVALVLADHPGNPPESRYKLSSGYRISDRLVLTAAHGLPGATTLTVRLGGEGDHRPVTCQWHDEQADLALLRFEETPAARVMPVRLGRVNREGPYVDAHAMGYPSSAVITDDVADETGEGYRGRVEVSCEIRTADSGAPGTLRVRLADWAPAVAPPGRSPWEGMSGAAVITRQSGLLVGVFRSHVTMTGVSVHEITALDLVDDEVWRTQLRDEHIDPRPRPTFPQGWDHTGNSLRPHRALPLSQPVDEDDLDFVDPGEHASSPSRILERLTELAHSPSRRAGVVVTGGAGAGKSRVCEETAALADSQHWLVVRLTEATSLEAVRSSVSKLADRILLVADDIHWIADNADIHTVCAGAIRSGAELAVLTSARSLLDLETQPLAPRRNFEEIAVRSDARYLDAICRGWVGKFASDAVAQKGAEYVVELCAGDPAISKLLTRYYNMKASAGHDLSEAVRFDQDISNWLQNVLSDVGLPVRERYAEPAPATTAAARIAVSVPCTVDEGLTFFAEAGVARAEAASTIDRLASIGLLRYESDRLWAGHDLYVDLLLSHALLTPEWDGVRPEALSAMLGAGLAGGPALLTQVARAVDRLREAHGNTGEKLAGKVDEWCKTNIDKLTELVTKDPKGELLRTLLPLPTWRPVMQRSLAKAWLRKQYQKVEALDVLLAVASYLPADFGQPYLMGWLGKHAAKPRAALAFQRLEPSRDLKFTARAAEEMYEFLVHHAERVEASRVLDQLLDTSKVFGLPHGDPRAGQVVTWALAWLERHPDKHGTGFVARPLMLRPELKGARVEETARLLLDDVAPRDPDAASFAIEPVLRRQRLHRDVPDHLVNQAVQAAMDWLRGDHGYGLRPEAAYLLKELVAPGLSGRNHLPRAVQAAWNWLKSNPLRPEEPGLVLPSLLRNARLSPTSSNSALTTDEYADLGRITVHWLTLFRSSRKGRYTEVLGELLRTRLLDDDADLLDEHVTLALTLLGETPGPSQARNLLPPLLRKTAVSHGTRQRIMAVAHHQMAEHATSEHTAYSLSVLLGRKDLSRQEHREAVDATLTCLDAHPTAGGAPKLLRAACGSPLTSGDDRDRLVSRTSRMLSTRILCQKRKESLTHLVLMHRAELPADWNRYVAGACRLVEQRGGLPAATMTGLKTMLEGTDRLDPPTLEQLHRTCLASCEVHHRSDRAIQMLAQLLADRTLSRGLRSRTTQLAVAILPGETVRKDSTGGLLLALLREGDLRGPEAVGDVLEAALSWLERRRDMHGSALSLLQQVKHRAQRDLGADERVAVVRRAVVCLDAWRSQLPAEDIQRHAAAEDLRRQFVDLTDGDENH